MRVFICWVCARLWSSSWIKSWGSLISCGFGLSLEISAGFGSCSVDVYWHLRSWPELLILLVIRLWSSPKILIFSALLLVCRWRGAYCPFCCACGGGKDRRNLLRVYWVLSLSNRCLIRNRNLGVIHSMKRLNANHLKFPEAVSSLLGSSGFRCFQRKLRGFLSSLPSCQCLLPSLHTQLSVNFSSEGKRLSSKTYPNHDRPLLQSQETHCGWTKFPPSWCRKHMLTPKQ